MTREEIIHIITTCGNQSVGIGERWKSIKDVCFDNSRGISNFQQKIVSKEVMFIDQEVTVDSTQVRITGFYIIEGLPNEIDFVGKAKYITFVPCDVVQGITFLNDGDNPIIDIEQFVNSKYGLTTMNTMAEITPDAEITENTTNSSQP